jgi:hypothetical protein
MSWLDTIAEKAFTDELQKISSSCGASHKKKLKKKAALTKYAFLGVSDTPKKTTMNLGSRLNPGHTKKNKSVLPPKS